MERLTGKRGFYIHNRWYELDGRNGHDQKALDIIEKNGWNKEWLESKYRDQKDFLIFKKGAVQLGCGLEAFYLLLHTRDERHDKRISDLKKNFDIDINKYKIVPINAY